MSRNISYSYEITNATEQQHAKWMRLWDAGHTDLYPDAVCQGGGGNEPLSVWLYCNKSAMRRYWARLDAYFGAEGAVVDLNKLYADDLAREAAR